MSWFNWDITFCPNEKCLLDCRRHPKNKPTGVPVSVLVENPKSGDYKCPMYLPEPRKM